MKGWISCAALLTILALPVRAEISVEQEVALGRQAAQHIEAETGIDNSPDLNQRLQRLAQAMVPVCGRNDIQYQFKVLNSDEFNAMSLPGGFIYATRKLMRDMSDGELAFVLGHELAHVTQRHSIHQMENDQMRRMGLLAILFGLSQGRINRQSVQLAEMVDQVVSSRYSQADEDEADRLGTEIMARAGIDPAYALLALHTLANQHDGGMPQFVNAILGSHPLPQDRVFAAYQYIPPLAYSPGPPTSRTQGGLTRLPLQPPTSGIQGGLTRLPLQPPTSSWGAVLSEALAQSTDLRPDAALMSSTQRQLEHLQLDNAGVLLVSPAGESYSQLERRVLAQELPWLLASHPESRGFGVAVRDNPAGERLLWLKVR